MNYKIDDELNVIGKYATNTAHIDAEMVVIQDVTLRNRPKHYRSGRYVDKLTVGVKNLPQWMRKGGALSSSILTYVDGSEGNLKVTSQKRNPRMDEGTEVLEMKDRKHSER